MGVIRALTMAALGAALTGCAAGPALVGPSTGHVTGSVMVRACGGAYGEDQPPCRVSSASEAQVIFQLEGASGEQTATTDGKGRYAIDLKPGTYTVQVLGVRGAALSSASAARVQPRFAGPSTVSVVAGKALTADFTFTIQLL